MKVSDNKTLVTWITAGVKTTYTRIVTVLTMNSLETRVAWYLPDREMRQLNLAWLFETYFLPGPEVNTQTFLVPTIFHVS